MLVNEQLSCYHLGMHISLRKVSLSGPSQTLGLLDCWLQSRWILGQQTLMEMSSAQARSSTDALLSSMSKSCRPQGAFTLGKTAVNLQEQTNLCVFTRAPAVCHMVRSEGCRFTRDTQLLFSYLNSVSPEMDVIRQSLQRNPQKDFVKGVSISTSENHTYGLIREIVLWKLHP